MTGKIKALSIDKANQQESEKQEYLVVGSDNHWYASGLESLTEARKEIKRIQKINKNNLPETFYIYKATEVISIYN